MYISECNCKKSDLKYPKCWFQEKGTEILAQFDVEGKILV